MFSLLNKLIRRKLIGAIYPESGEYREKLSQILATRPATVYTGFDATANSLHVGHLATIISSMYFYTQGHQVICVIGDATAQVGDPSGHDADRKRIPQAVIDQNATSIELTLRNLFTNFQTNFLTRSDNNNGIEDFDNLLEESLVNRLEVETGDEIILKPPIIVRNSEWYKGENVVEFVDNIFRDVRVGGLLHKKSIQERLGTGVGMNMAEFCYQIFQAYDWLQLRKRYDCKLQIGGNDQQGNIYTGHDLIKKCLGKKDSIGLLAPLITDSKGRKLGKTTMGPKSFGIWLKPDLTSPYDLYQFFHRTPDNDVEKLLRVFTFYHDDHIDNLVKNRLRDKRDIWYCQRKLAEHACLIVHGCDGLDEARRITDSLFTKTK